MSDDICEIPYCKEKAELTWGHKRICNKHWLRHCDDDDSFDLVDEVKR